MGNLERFHQGMERLIELTGSSNASEIINKLKGSEKLGESLLEQQKTFEQELNNLKAEYSIMEKKLEQIALTNEKADKDAENNEVTTEVHNIDEKMFKAEMNLMKNRRLLLNSEKFLEEVKSGVNHLAKMVGKHSS